MGLSLKKETFITWYSEPNDIRHAKINYKIEMRHWGNGERKHAELNCRINLSVGRSEQPKGSLEEWSWIHDQFWEPISKA